MLERYTDKTRRVIFSSRYEASRLGSPRIESEHMLLGVLQNSQALTEDSQPLGVAWALLVRHKELMREPIERRALTIQEQVSTSFGIPFSEECKRVLAYAGEEAERLADKSIGIDHLLLGVLREEDCFAAKLLNARGIVLENVRAQLARVAELGSGI